MNRRCSNLPPSPFICPTPSLYFSPPSVCSAAVTSKYECATEIGGMGVYEAKRITCHKWRFSFSVICPFVVYLFSHKNPLALE